MTSGENDRDGTALPVSPPVHPGSVTELLSKMARGDRTSLSELFRRFFPRMAGLARKTMQLNIRTRASSEDVAQSAFCSFWCALAGGREFQLQNRDDLWKLLAVITARKARKRARYESAEKRGGFRVTQSLDENSEDARSATIGAALADISPPDFDLCCEELLLELDKPTRMVALLRLQGFSSHEIAEQLGCTQRTIQRRLESIRRLWHSHGEFT
jgi:RNA polymerase sigma factor (sigma-70 family)